MISYSQIQAFSQQIVEQFQPEQIILFGSYAYGQPSQGSDVDLLVILPFEGLPVHKAIKSLDELTAYAVEFRYPEISDDQSIANQAFTDCNAIRQVMQCDNI